MSRFVIFLCLLITLASCGNKYSADLKVVDKALQNADQNQKIAEEFADSIAILALKEENTRPRIEKLVETSDLYKSLHLLKSIDYLLKAHYLAAHFSPQPADSLYTLMKIASLYNTEGMMVKEAADIYKNIDPNLLDQQDKLEYFILGVQINNTLAERTFSPPLKKSYEAITASLRDSVIKYDPNSLFIKTNILIGKGENLSALKLMRENMPGEEVTRKGPYYHHLSGIFKNLELPDSQIYYLSLAAADDLNHGVKDYKALTELAEAISPYDIHRAYKYISQSRNDALEFNSSARTMEIAPVFNLIQNSYSQRQKNFFFTIIIILLALMCISGLIIAGYITVKKKNKSLVSTREELRKSHALLNEANLSLEKINDRLAASSRLKESYIHSFMELCLTYLAKMEAFRARLGAIAAKGDLKKLSQTINSSRYVNLEINDFYERFDRSFLAIYPHFFDILNNFLQEEYRYAVKETLSTEIRIYALIWTGMTSSSEIAKFLRCSDSTVYNYRTQMRNKAIHRDKFEEEFIRLSSDSRFQ